MTTLKAKSQSSAVPGTRGTLSRSGREGYGPEEAVSRLRRPSGGRGILASMDRRIGLLRRAGRLGTARNWERARNSFSRFTGGRDLPFYKMTGRLVGGYNSFLEGRGLLRNSISFYMRILRAAYNQAADRGLVRQAFPFRQVYTGIDKTRKRAVGEETVLRLFHLELPAFSALDFARDLFIFSYCTRGMAFVDIAYLKKKDLRGGEIRYARHKTRQTLCVRIEVAARKIIDKYAGLAPDTPYLFPILTGRGEEADFREYCSALDRQNRMLKKLSALLPDGCRLTSYTARHTWATAARNHQVPLSVISVGLGHTSERTTRIYLAELENAAIDSANRELLRRLE